MNACDSIFAVSCIREQSCGADTLQREQELNRFLADVEKRALRIAEISIRDRDEALDLVQNAMIKLVRKYSGRTSEEWTPLFYRILQNETGRPVPGEVRIATLTVCRPATPLAHHHRRVATAVEKHHHLFAALQHRSGLCQSALGDTLVEALLAQVEHPPLRHWRAGGPQA
jgi:DNA-directed RNA polymerase specialized sigma24 family protein